MASSYTHNTQKSFAATKKDLAECFRKWGVRRWEVESLGERSASWGQNEETRTVHLHFTKAGGQEVSLSYGKQNRAVDNIRVLYFAVDDMRMAEVRGTAELQAEAYLQLAAPPRARNPREVLGINAGADLELAESAYRTLAKRYHPDSGGNADQMAELNVAIEQLRKDVAP